MPPFLLLVSKIKRNYLTMNVIANIMINVPRLGCLLRVVVCTRTTSSKHTVSLFSLLEAIL